MAKILCYPSAKRAQAWCCTPIREELAALTRPAQALRVGTVDPAPLWQLISLLLEHFPGTVLTSETLSEREIIRRLLDRSLDLGIGAHPVMLPTIR